MTLNDVLAIVALTSWILGMSASCNACRCRRRAQSRRSCSPVTAFV